MVTKIKYRKLKHNEILKRGDSWWDGTRWTETSLEGHTVPDPERENSYKYRRIKQENHDRHK